MKSLTSLVLIASSIVALGQHLPPGAPTCNPNDPNCNIDNGCNTPNRHCYPVPPTFSVKYFGNMVSHR